MVVEIVVELTAGMPPRMATVATVPTVKGEARIVEEGFSQLEQSGFGRRTKRNGGGQSSFLEVDQADGLAVDVGEIGKSFLWTENSRHWTLANGKACPLVIEAISHRHLSRAAYSEDDRPGLREKHEPRFSRTLSVSPDWVMLEVAEGGQGLAGFVKEIGDFNAGDSIAHDSAPKDAGPRGGNVRIQSLMGKEQIASVRGKGDATHVVPRQCAGGNKAKLGQTKRSHFIGESISQN